MRSLWLSWGRICLSPVAGVDLRRRFRSSQLRSDSASLLFRSGTCLSKVLCRRRSRSRTLLLSLRRPRSGPLTQVTRGNSIRWRWPARWAWTARSTQFLRLLFESVYFLSTQFLQPYFFRVHLFSISAMAPCRNAAEPCRVAGRTRAARAGIFQKTGGPGGSALALLRSQTGSFASIDWD